MSRATFHGSYVVVASHVTLHSQAKINELRGALAEDRSDAETGTHSDGVPFGGEAKRLSSSFYCPCMTGSTNIE
jgi:hypothetical protein